MTTSYSGPGHLGQQLNNAIITSSTASVIFWDRLVFVCIIHVFYTFSVFWQIMIDRVIDFLESQG